MNVSVSVKNYMIEVLVKRVKCGILVRMIVCVINYAKLMNFLILKIVHAKSV